jgi:hypothetical protein|tara:strand:+ start:4014 stop:4550 length:537 start_codon:yes stop_codon:yes gene_type:complete
MADKKLVLNNVEVCWAKLQEPDNKWKSEELEYSLCVKVTPQLTDLMSDYKLNKTIKGDKEATFDGESYIGLNLDKHTRGGWTRFGNVYDKKGNLTNQLVGNGSKMNLFITIGDSQYGNLIKLGHLKDMDHEAMEMVFDFGQVMELVSFEAPSAVIKQVEETVASVDAAPEEDMEIPFD